MRKLVVRRQSCPPPRERGGSRGVEGFCKETSGRRDQGWEKRSLRGGGGRQEIGNGPVTSCFGSEKNVPQAKDQKPIPHVLMMAVRR